MDSTSTVTGQPSSPLRQIASRVRRVASMGIAEVGYRGWQESAKWIDRQRVDRSRVEPIQLLRREAPALADLTPGLDAITSVFDRRFFDGTSQTAVAEFRNRFPEACRTIEDEADRLLRGHFDLLGYQDLSFGMPIDWHLDAVSGRRAPATHWSRIDPLAPSQVGDSKVAWELSRHQWIVRLAQAYALTGKVRYRDAAIAAIEHWIDNNPVGRGLNWASSLEVAFRLISWTWTVALLRHDGALTAPFLARLCAAIHAHATHIRKYLSYYFSPNTHLTGEALGLFYAGVMYPHFRDANEWRDTGARILREQAGVQISDSGIYFEQSTCYQRYTCEFYLHFLLLASRADVDVPATLQARLLQMIDFLVALRRPDGTMPLIGDADDGSLMPLVRRAPDDFDGVFAAAAAMFRRPDYAASSGGCAPEVLWLLGPDGVRQFDAIDPDLRAVPPSRAFEGGYAVMRNGWKRDAHQMIVDAGPLGCPVSAGHGHEDLLAIQLSVFGDRVIVDPGTYSYSDAEWRNYFRTANAHSTITIDGVGFAEPTGPFSWKRRPRAVLREWISTDSFDFVDAEHNAYAQGPSPVTHRRRVMFVKPLFWVVIDEITGGGVAGSKDQAPRDVELTFQFAPLDAELTTSGACRVTTERGFSLSVRPFASSALTTTLYRGSEEPRRGWVSDGYGRKQPSPALVCSTTTTLPLRAITVLYPSRDHSAPAIDAIHNNGILTGVRVGGVAVQIDHDRIQLLSN